MSPPTRIGIEAWTGRGLQVTGWEVDEVAVELGIGAGPQRPHVGDILVVAGPTPLPRDAQRVELLLEPADAEAELDPPPDSWSSVASSLASTSGLRWGTMRMQLPSRNGGCGRCREGQPHQRVGDGGVGLAGTLPSAVYG